MHVFDHGMHSLVPTGGKKERLIMSHLCPFLFLAIPSCPSSRSFLLLFPPRPRKTLFRDILLPLPSSPSSSFPSSNIYRACDEEDGRRGRGIKRDGEERRGHLTPPPTLFSGNLSPLGNIARERRETEERRKETDWNFSFHSVSPPPPPRFPSFSLFIGRTALYMQRTGRDRQTDKTRSSGPLLSCLPPDGYCDHGALQ